MALKSVADEYFSNLNPTASRLYTDLQETKSSYEELWSSLSEKEQQAILTESIIKPEISVQYYASELETENRKYAVKLIFDDHCSYRDEHSGPFSLRTQSQRDLSLFKVEKPKQMAETKVRVHKPKMKVPEQRFFKFLILLMISFQPPPPPIPKAQPSSPPISVVNKDASKPEMCHNIVDNAVSSTLSNSLPKTGLDFLDNW